MSETGTGSATPLPPRDVWMPAVDGLRRWRPVITVVTVERIGGPDKGHLLTVREDGNALASVPLSDAEAAHLAELLAPKDGA